MKLEALGLELDGYPNVEREAVDLLAGFLSLHSNPDTLTWGDAELDRLALASATRKELNVSVSRE